MSSLSPERRYPRLTARRLARIVCCLSAMVGLSLPAVSQAVVPVVCAIAPLAESESSPVKESEPTSGETAEFEDLIRLEGRRLCYRPAPLTGSLTPPAISSLGRISAFADQCPATEHALRDGLGAPLRI